MGVIGLDHVQLAIPQGGEGEARDFYVGVLGMREVAKPANLSPSGCWFEGGAISLHVGVDPEFRAARKAHPALLVDDIAALENELKTKGFPVQSGKQIAGYTRFFTEDPFGNRIEVMQRNNA